MKKRVPLLWSWKRGSRGSLCLWREASSVLLGLPWPTRENLTLFFMLLTFVITATSLMFAPLHLNFLAEDAGAISQYIVAHVYSAFGKAFQMWRMLCLTFFFEFILSVTIFSWHWIQNNLCFCSSVIKWVWCVHILWKATTKLGLSISIWYWLFYVPVATLSWIYIHPSFVCVDDDGWIISILSKNRYHLRWVINIKLSDVIITFCELENIGGKMVQTYRKVLSRLSPRRAEENY